MPLVLSRKAGESIVIGNVTLTVLHVKGSRVHLGVEAPPSVVIRRAELDPSLVKPRLPPDAETRKES